MTNRINASVMQLAVLAASSLSSMHAMAVTYDDGNEHEVVDNLSGEEIVVTDGTTLNLSSNGGDGFEINSLTADDAVIRVTGPGHVQTVDMDNVTATFLGAPGNRLVIRNGASPSISIKGESGRYTFRNVSIEGPPSSPQLPSALSVDGSSADIVFRDSRVFTSKMPLDDAEPGGVIRLKNYAGALTLDEVQLNTTTSPDTPIIDFENDRAKPTSNTLNVKHVQAQSNAGFMRSSGDATVKIEGSQIQTSGLAFRGGAMPSKVNLSVQHSSLTADPNVSGPSVVSIDRQADDASMTYEFDVSGSVIDAISASRSNGVINVNNSSISSSNNGSRRALNFNGGDHTVNIDYSSIGPGAKDADSVVLYNAGTDDRDTTRLIIKNTELQGSGINAKGIVRVDMQQAAYWTGKIENFTSMKLAAFSKLSLTGPSSIDELTNNSGVVSLAGGGAVGNVLNVHNYTSNGGSLLLRTQLGDDASPTDKLVVSGNTEGLTSVTVSNAGGSGAPTRHGIELIHVSGASNGVFVQWGRIVAGAYDYTLNKLGKNWYLNSTPPDSNPEPTSDPDADQEPVTQPETRPDTTPAADPPAPAPAPAPAPKPTPAPSQEPSHHVVRPEAAAYLANQAASSMFLTSLRDRAGENRYANTRDDKGHTSSMWLRQGGAHARFRDSTDQTRTQGNSYVMQLGGDVAQFSRHGRDRFHLGVMAGYGNSRSNSRSQVSGHRAKGSVDGYNIGVYGTWYQNDIEGTGAYADGQVLYNWFNNQVSGDDIPKESYRSEGVLASAEAGYTLVAGASRAAGHTTRYLLEPYAGITWMGVSNGDHKESNGTRVQVQGRGNVQSALGLRAYIQNIPDSNTISKRWFRPFAEISWLHNTKRNDVTMNGVRLEQAGAQDVAEIKLGLHAQFNPQAALWGSIGHRMGERGYGKTIAAVGVSYRF